MIYDGPGRRRGFRRDADLRRPGGQVQVPHGAAQEHRPLAGVLPQRRVREAGRCHSLPPRSDAALQPGQRPASTRISRSAWDRASTSRMLHPLFRNGGIELSESQIRDVTQFVKTGLLDPRAKKENLCGLIPKFGAERAAGADVRGMRGQAGQARHGLTRSVGIRDSGLAI